MSTPKKTPTQDFEAIIQALEKRVSRLEKLVGIETSNSNPSKDELYEEVCKDLLYSTKCSASSIQRKFSIGYNRAARIIDYLANLDMISTAKGAEPRIVHTDQIKQYLAQLK